MTIASDKARFTPEDLLNMPDAVAYELVGGQLVDRKMGTESSMVAVAIATILRNFVKPRKLGFVAGSDCSYQSFPNEPAKTRRADVSFIAAGRLPNNQPPKGHARVAPDLAVEVLSPGDLAYEIDEKIAEYLSVGVKLIWIVNPISPTVRIYRPAGSPRGAADSFNEDDSITGEDVLPGFECRVAEFFEI